jgi:hypothetical protein
VGHAGHLKIFCARQEAKLTTRTQQGSLKEISGGAQTVRVKIEYQSPTIPWTPSDTGRTGMEIINIIVEDGQPLPDGDYQVTVEDDDGFFHRGRQIRLRNDGGRWSQLP